MIAAAAYYQHQPADNPDKLSVIPSLWFKILAAAGHTCYAKPENKQVLNSTNQALFTSFLRRRCS